MKVNVFEGARRIALVIGGLWIVGCGAWAFITKPYVSVTYTISGPGELHVLADRCDTNDAATYTSVEVAEGDSVNVELCFTASRADDGRMLVPYAVASKGRTLRDLELLSGQEPTESLPSATQLMPLLREADAKGDVVSARKLAVAISALEAAEWYAAWIVDNKRPKGSPEFEKQAKAYRDRKGEAAKATKAAAEAGAIPAWMLDPEVKTIWLMQAKNDVAVLQYTAGVRDRFDISAREKESLVALRREEVLAQWKQAGLIATLGLVAGWSFVVVVGWIVRGFLGIRRGRDSRADS